MSLDNLVDAMKEQADKLKELGHTVLFDLGDDGKILLDATGEELTVTPDPEDDEAETTLTLSTDDMVKLIKGDLNPGASEETDHSSASGKRKSRPSKKECDKNKNDKKPPREKTP